MRQLAYTMFISNNLPSFHLWWKKNLVNHWKSQNIMKMIVFKTFFTFYVFFNNKFGQEHSYQARNLSKNSPKSNWNQTSVKWSKKLLSGNRGFWSILQLNCSLFRLKQCQKLKSYHNCQRNSVWRSLRCVTIKKQVLETISCKILETNSSFHVK